MYLHRKIIWLGVNFVRDKNNIFVRFFFKEIEELPKTKKNHYFFTDFQMISKKKLFTDANPVFTEN